MPELSVTFNEILSNRQSQRSQFQSKLETVQNYASKYNRLANWTKENRNSLLTFNPEVKSPLTDLETFVNNQLKLIQTLLGTSSKEEGVIKQLLSRIERSWVSFSAIGAKRQGKGHMLSTLLNLQPENDIFLARAGKPCTATVVTLYQGPKREAKFKEDGTFDCWNSVDQNKAFVYFHTYESIVSLIQQYFEILKINGTFSLSSHTSEGFIKACDNWIEKVKNHKTNDADVEYKELLRDYLEHAKEYASNLNSEPQKIDVDNLPSKSSNKIDFVNADLRKYISYYRREQDEDDDREKGSRYFDVLAVKKVDIYTNYEIGEFCSNSFVISDTAGIGEAKLNLRETLKDLLKNNIDIALAVTKVPDDTDGDLSIPRQVIDFHNTISSDKCFACFPLQFYYIINVRKSTLDTYSETDINDFKNSLISHIKDRGMQIPSVGMIKPWDNTTWTEQEVEKWNESHIKIIDVDNHNDLNEYFKNFVLPNVANDIAIIDNELLKSIDTTITSLTDNDSLLIEKCNQIMSLVPMYESDINDSKVDEIKKKILSVLNEDFDNLSKTISSIKELTDKPELKDAQLLKDHQKKTIIDCISMLYQFQSKIEEFYNEPDWYRTIHTYNSKFELSTSDREICAGKKASVIVSKDKEALMRFRKWEFNEWDVVSNERESLLSSITDELIALLESLDADEIGTLATYRLDILNELRNTTDNILNSLATEAYSSMVKMIWQSFYEDGYFEKLVESKIIDDYKNTIVEIFDQSKKYNNVVAVLNTIDSKELSVIDKDLRKKTHHSLAVAKIQPLVIRDLTSEADIPRVLANSFWEHLVSIEWDYKMSVSRLFKKDAILADFKKTFMHLIATISHKLIEQDTNYVGTKDSQKQFLNFYLNNFQRILPDNNLAETIQLKDKINELKQLIQ